MPSELQSPFLEQLFGHPRHGRGPDDRNADAVISETALMTTSAVVGTIGDVIFYSMFF
jgi:hypothetical protein